VWYSLSRLSLNDQEQIQISFTEANYYWVALSVLLGFLSHLIRAERWRLALKPLGFKTNIIDLFASVCKGYLVNLVVPRAGELSRAAAIQASNGVPMEKAFGTIVTERVVDLVMLVLVIIIALSFQTDYVLALFKESIMSNPYKILIVLLIFSTVLALLYLVVFKIKSRFNTWIKTKLKGLIAGLLSVLKMKDKGLYTLYSFLIWILYLTMFYAGTQALEGTQDLPIAALFTAFIAGTFSIATTNGGIGTYPLGIQQALLLYGSPAITGLSFGWIMWSTQTLLVIVLGGISFLFLSKKPQVN
jgi:hypothetical protein